MIIDELIAILGYDIKGQGNLDRFNRGLDRTAQRAQAAATKINAISVAIGSFAGVAAFTAVNRLASSIGSLPGDVLSVGREFENLETVLTTIEGSADKAKSSLEWVKDFAATTPYDLKQVAEGFVRMRAYGLDPMSGELRSIGDAAAGMGKSLMQGVEAIADAAQVENERLKEFGVRAKAEGDSITYSWQQNGQQMSRTVRKNGIEITKALTEIFDARFGGAMDALSDKQGGILSKLGDQWTSFLGRIGEKGFYDDVTRRLRGLQDRIAAWDKDGLIDRAASAISGFLSGAMDIGGHLGSQFLAVGKGALDAANGIAELISKVTGLNQVASAGIVGAAVLGSSAMGRGLLVALAKRIPLIGALLVADDLVSAASGKDSVIVPAIEKMTGGPEALAAAGAAMSSLNVEAGKLVDSLGKLGGIQVVEGSFVTKLGSYFDSALVGTINATAKAIEAYAKALEILQKWIGGEGETANTTPRTHRPTVSDLPAPDEPNSSRFDTGVPAVNGLAELRTALEYFNANSDRANGSGQAVLEDHSVDNRNQSRNVEVNVGGVHVQQPTQAPAAVGAAVGNAAGNAAADSVQIQSEPAF